MLSGGAEGQWQEGGMQYAGNARGSMKEYFDLEGDLITLIIPKTSKVPVFRRACILTLS